MRRIRWSSTDKLPELTGQHCVRLNESKSPSVDLTPLDSMKRIAAEWDRDRRVLSSWVDEALNSPELSVAAGFQPVLEHTGAQLHIARVLAEGHPLIHSTPFWLESSDPEEVWEQLYYAVMLWTLQEKWRRPTPVHCFCLEFDGACEVQRR